jgi:hypothetical protein
LLLVSHRSEYAHDWGAASPQPDRRCRGEL